MKLLKPLLPVLWLAKNFSWRAASFFMKLEHDVLLPAMDKIDRTYADRRFVHRWQTKEKHLHEWHVVDFKDDFVLACNLTFQQACRVQNENYAGLTLVQDDGLTPEMLAEVKKDREVLK
jgi:hypothetical protein